MKKTIKKILKWFFIIIGVFVISLVGLLVYLKIAYQQKSYSWLYVNEINLSESERVSDFEEVCKILKGTNSFVIQRIDFDKLAEKYAKQVENTQSSIEYTNLLAQFFAELQNGHTSVNFYCYKGNYWATIIDNRVFVDGVINKELNPTIIKPKDEIVAINNIPIGEWLDAEKLFAGSSTLEHRLTKLTYHIFTSYTDTVRTFKIRNAEGESEVTIPLYKDLKSDIDTLYVIGKMLNDSVAYLKIITMGGNRIFPQFQQVYPSLSNASHIIIDVRENGGGNSGTSEKIAKYFIAKPQTACVSGQQLEPVVESFKGKVYLLIGNATFSAAENFVIDLKESGNVTVIGEPTGGDTGNRPREFQTSHGIVFRIPTRKKMQISPQGFPMEGVGIEPHHLVRQSAEDYLEGKDTVLEYTLDLLSK